jgi:nicotinamidase-related amidase
MTLGNFIAGVKQANLPQKKENWFVRSKRKKFVPTDNSIQACEASCFARVPRPSTDCSMSMSSTDKGLLTPQNCAVVFLDHQPQMFAAVSGPDRKGLLDSVLVLARAAKIFRVPVILSLIEFKEFVGKLAPELSEEFPEHAIVKRTSINAWDDPRFVAAIKHTGRRNFLLAGLWSEACLVFPALQMLDEGYGIYVVKDASWGTNGAAHDMALRRVEQAGGVSLTALQVLLELQRDWAKSDHYEEVMAMVKPCCQMNCPEEDFRATTADDPAPNNKLTPHPEAAS